MSDYLWDRKGEPDADVARLETLLGAFRHEPRPLELPDEAATPGPRPATLLPFAPRPRASRLYAAAAAAAAALLVASVLVASSFLRARVQVEDRRAAAPGSARPVDAAPQEARAGRPEVARQMIKPPSGAVGAGGGTPTGKVKDEKAAVESLLARGGGRRKGAQPAAAPGRQRKGSGADAVKELNLGAMRPGLSGSALVENTRLLTKEQLVYALRLTGAKLRDVREKARGAEAEARPLR